MTKIMKFILYRVNYVALLNSDYRTENENEVFKIMRLFQAITRIKRKSDNRKCSFVALCRLFL